MISRFVRRVVDLVAAAAALALVGPGMTLLGAIIRLDSPGPAIFRQNRVGKGGKVFRLLKFRTMRADVDPYGFSPGSEDDPRVTRVGRWLRKTSLDELPQLINILQGDMSLVGPRPLLPWQYALWTDRQRRRCEVKPGLTGWAQVHGRAALTHEEKIELDVWYVDHAGLWLDLRILLRTAAQVIRRRDTFELQYSRRPETDGHSDT